MAEDPGIIRPHRKKLSYAGRSWIHETGLILFLRFFGVFFASVLSSFENGKTKDRAGKLSLNRNPRDGVKIVTAGAILYDPPRSPPTAKSHPGVHPWTFTICPGLPRCHRQISF